MNGPEHYAEAERLLEEAANIAPVAGQLTAVTEGARLRIKAAAVHAQLAEVALKFDMRTKEQGRETRHGPDWKRATQGTLSP